MGRTMQISSPVRALGRNQNHVIDTSMSSQTSARRRASTPSHEEYSIFNPVMCPAVVCWVKDPDPPQHGLESIQIAAPISKEMSCRSLQGEGDFHDADTDFREVESPVAQLWKEIHTDISTHTPEFEQMHPHPLRPMSPNTFLERNNFLTPERTPNPSGQLNRQQVLEQSNRNAYSNGAGSKSPRRNIFPPSSPDNNCFSRDHNNAASVTNSPQHPSMWNASPAPHRTTPMDNCASNVTPLNIPKPSLQKHFGWLTPSRAGPLVEPTSPDFARETQQQRDPRLMTSPSSNKLGYERNEITLTKPSPASKEKSDKPDKLPGRGWKNLSRSISPMFTGRKTESTSTLKTITRDLGVSFQGSRRRGHAAKPATSLPNWSGEGSMISPELEKEGFGGSQIGYSSELTRSGSVKSTKSGASGVLSFLNWGKKKGNGTKINDLFQVVDQGSVKLDTNSFKVMEYTIKTLHYKLEQAKKNEQTTAEEFKALQAAMDAAEGKCQQWQQRCQELESQLGVRQTEAKDIELDYEIAKLQRENTGSGSPKHKPHRFTTLEVTPSMFQKHFEDSKLCVKKLASALCIHIRESGESATQVVISLLEQQRNSPREISKMPRNVIVLYFEAFLNQILYENFENVSFEPNGATDIYDLDALRSSCCKAYNELKKQDWPTIERSLGKSGSTIVNPTFHRFFVIRMELILSQLTKVTDKETSLSLLATFFNAFKSVWLLHHLAFANENSVTIFRAPSTSDFDPRFMEQVTTYEEDPSRSKISVMVNPGFIVNRHTIKCQVFCSSKYQ
ncbi:uncharacterized protein [Physcomitrium patens]|uniref:DUF641 domain-containing protein n=1 Tax=Physcomitrium patens TaxID=3218 RepID=A0A2K1JRZ3_PHYPA|nr:uncharacterized protein LOC112289188 [Physcomitrium patens]PNR44305.1 hypothetical protein PHYPA_016689 [Physcomitrium patens]|eukprot:XP_024389957.1 uncharacterized protein LOC112289188 [Physcomitrella patens]